ncbi:MAG TPA: hypothetical protein VF665_17410 [Longimicrobium sp.]|jgi:hypothetical protein|uniref:hypothetical protein n=1 Tax=Longimicrobium sp. TaxID=2029185 RepID=UPI002EDB0CAC
MRQSATLSISIPRGAAEVYAFVADGANLPRWAAGLGSGARSVDGGWEVQTEAGTAWLRYAETNAFGVLDHTVRLPDGGEVYVPMRVVADGEGSLVLFTVFREAGMTDEQFAADARAVARDLETLAGLLGRG